MTIMVAIIAAAAIAAGISVLNKTSDPSGPLPVHLPTTPQSYLGVYAARVPASYDGVTSFRHVTGVRPDVVMYYSGWYEPFPKSFATTAAENGAVPFVQIDPTGVSVAAIASGRYDGYLSSYAEACRQRLPAPRDPELRPRDERDLVLLGFRAHIPEGVRGRLEAHRHSLPRAGNQQRDLAVDRQYHRRHPARQDSSPGPVVAR